MSTSIQPPSPPVVSGGDTSPIAPAPPINVGYTMTPASVLQYCQKQMESINTQFNSQVEEINGKNNDATTIGQLKSMITPYVDNGLNFSPHNATDPHYTAIDNALTSDIAQAQSAGNTSLVTQLTNIKSILESGGDTSVSSADIKSMSDGLDTIAASITSDQQIAMIQVGQTANNLNSMLTQMSQLIQGIDQTSLKIAGNT